MGRDSHPRQAICAAAWPMGKPTWAVAVTRASDSSTARVRPATRPYNAKATRPIPAHRVPTLTSGEVSLRVAHSTMQPAPISR